MARKSRKTQVRNKPVAEVKKEAAALPTAIYARLSVENSGKDDDGNSCKTRSRSARTIWRAAPISGSRRSTRTTEKPELCSTVRRGTA